MGGGCKMSEDVNLNNELKTDKRIDFDFDFTLGVVDKEAENLKKIKTDFTYENGTLLVESYFYKEVRGTLFFSA